MLALASSLGASIILRAAETAWPMFDWSVWQRRGCFEYIRCAAGPAQIYRIGVRRRRRRPQIRDLSSYRIKTRRAEFIFEYDSISLPIWWWSKRNPEARSDAVEHYVNVVVDSLPFGKNSEA